MTMSLSRLAAEQKSRMAGKEYTNIKYSAEQPGADHLRTPLCMSTLSLQQNTINKPAKPVTVSRTVSSSSLSLPLPPDAIPRSVYENLPPEQHPGRKQEFGTVVDLNIGPPPSKPPPLPPSKPK